MPEPGASTGADELRVDPDRPVDPKAAELRAERNPLRRLGKVLGPGLITGASDDDPSSIGTHAQAGAQYGFATLWLTPVMLPMMAAVQYMCAKIGLVTGRGLAGVLREHYPRALYPAVITIVIANTLNAGADIGAIAAAINLLVPIPAVALIVPVSFGIIGLQVFGTYRLIANVFKWLALALLAYIGAALFARPDIGSVLAGTLVPTVQLDPKYIGIVVALLGTTISPYLFFWQASQEVEEQMSIGRVHLWQREGASRFELTNALWDTLAGAAFAGVIAYFIILTTGATLIGLTIRSTRSPNTSPRRCARSRCRATSRTPAHETSSISPGSVSVSRSALMPSSSPALRRSNIGRHTLGHPPYPSRQRIGGGRTSGGEPSSTFRTRRQRTRPHQ